MLGRGWLHRAARRFHREKEAEMADKAKFAAVQLKKGDREVTATTAVELVQYQYDGYAVVNEEKPSSSKSK